jgi:hypothetical protein
LFHFKTTFGSFKKLEGTSLIFFLKPELDKKKISYVLFEGIETPLTQTLKNG